MRIVTTGTNTRLALCLIRNGHHYRANRFVNQYLITRFPVGGHTWGRRVAFAAVGVGLVGPSVQVQILPMINVHLGLLFSHAKHSQGYA
jgi:hypothetical protein